jgi:hypothetical protein
MTRACEAALAADAARGGDARAADIPVERTVVLCDGDLGASAGQLVALAEAVERGVADLVVASFANPRGGGVGVLRRYAQRSLRARCGLQLRAPLSGQRALSARSLRAVLPFAHGFGMEAAMTFDAVAAGLAVAELELDLHHRSRGRTPAGFAHRGRQLVDVARALRARE